MNEAQIQAEIELARQASAQIAEQDRLRQTAEALPRLQAMLEQGRLQEQAIFELDQIKTVASAKLAALKVEVGSFNSRYDGIMNELEGLMDEKAALDKRVMDVLQNLRRDVDQHGPLAGQRLEETLAAVGFIDPQLDLLPGFATLNTFRGRLERFLFDLGRRAVFRTADWRLWI